jgi:hypothetical protein
MPCRQDRKTMKDRQKEAKNEHIFVFDQEQWFWLKSKPRVDKPNKSAGNDPRSR